jgi:hypothetical protein
MHLLVAGKGKAHHRSAVVFWLGFWFWWEHPGAELGRFFASLAVVGTWGGQPPSGVVGGGTPLSHKSGTRRQHKNKEACKKNERS